MNDTIVAISTTPGTSAISIIRVSGKNSIKITNEIFSNNLLNKKTHTITYGYIKDNDEIIDEVLISIMKSPKSYTTEDIVEISCHGGIATTNKILELLLKHKARLAEPGEFTKRAFINGRIDLTKAEAVMDLISIQTEKARKIAINNLKGKTSNQIRKIREQLIKILTNIEVNIDYPEYYDTPEITIEKIKKTLESIITELKQLIKNSESSKLITQGINVAIIGKPNVGKSSILNALYGSNKAIVTPIAGTTRDTIEARINLEGIILNLIDTAGIRATNNEVEKIGVKKSLETLEETDLIILVLNANEPLTKEDIKLLDLTKEKNRIIVLNKTDLEKRINIKNIDVVKTNTINENGIKPLKEKIKEMYNFEQIQPKDFTYISNKNSQQIIKEIIKVLQNTLNNKEIEILSIDIRYAWQKLGELLGETYNEEFLDNLFKNFCVGK